MSRLTEYDAQGIVAEAQQVINRYLQPGLGAELSTKTYDDTSEKYDDYCAAFEHLGPAKTAEIAGSLYPDPKQRETVRILDVAAGTGMVGVELQKLGFRHMDALDPSRAMLDVAKSRGVYISFFCNYIDDKQLPIDEIFRLFQYLGALGVTAQRKMASIVKGLYPDPKQRETLRVIDVGAGTGLVGVELQKIGCRHIDALEPSRGMLDVAKQRGIYTNFFCNFMDDKQLPIDESFLNFSYAAALGHTGPIKTAEAVGQLFSDPKQRETVRILDVGAGTGKVGVELHKLGFRNMDALDASPRMLEVSKSRGVYSNFICDYINDQQLAIEEKLKNTAS
nr:hypothetical protein BaRGS_008079 [Batillaria attramentaria]